MLQITSVKELKQLLEPLLKYKKTTLENNAIYTREDEIFLYFVNKKWKNASNLHLCDIVDDILNLEINDIEVFDK